MPRDSLPPPSSDFLVANPSDLTDVVFYEQQHVAGSGFIRSYPGMSYQLPRNVPNLKNILIRCTSNPADDWAAMGSGAQETIPLTGSPGAPPFVLFSTKLEDSGDYLNFASGALSYITALNKFKLIARVQDIFGNLSPGISVERAADSVPDKPPADMLIDLQEYADPGAPPSSIQRIFAKTDHTLWVYQNGSAIQLGSGGGGGGVSLQGSTPGTPDTGNFNVSGTGIMATAMFAGTGATAPTDSTIATTAIIGKAHGGETSILTLFNSNAAADGDTASLTFLHGGYSVATAVIRSVVEAAGSGLTGIGFSTYDSGLSEKHRMRGDGRFGLGIHSPFAVLHACSQPTYAAGDMILEQATADALGPTYYFRKERGIIDTPVLPNSGDNLGSILWTGYGSGGGTFSTLDSRVYITGAAIYAVTQGTIGTTRMPGKLVFATATNATPSVLTDRAWIDDAGLVNIVGLAASSAVYTDGSSNLTTTAPAGGNFADGETPSGTINSSNVTFTLAHTPSPSASLILFYNAQPQLVGTDFTISSATITFTNPPETGTWLRAWYRY